MMIEDDDLLLKNDQYIDLTSMIDIIFILLIFFMVSTTFNKLGVPIHIVRAKNVMKVLSETVDIVIDKTGKYYYDSNELTQQQLKQLVKTQLKKNHDVVFVLKPDQDTSTQSLLRVLDICKDAKAVNFYINAQKINK